MRLIDRISSDYVAEHAAFNQRALDRWYDGGCRGERPKTISTDFAMLERLADAILNEELTDTNPHKVTNTEYPFLSETQMERRRDGVRTRKDGGMRGETSLEVYEGGADMYHSGGGSQLASDGRNYRFPIRRTRSRNELMYVDAHSKSRNRERAAQYRKDTTAGRLVTYNLRDTGGELAPEFEACKGVGERWRNELSAVYV